jgi:DNA methylase
VATRRTQPNTPRCPICAHPVLRLPGAGRPPTYCSHACRQVAYRQRKHGIRRARLVTLVQADARTWLQTLPAESVDLVLTDPPYQFNRGTTYFRKWFPDLPDTAWPEIFTHLHRVLRPNRHCLICCDEPTQPIFDHAAQLAGFRRHRPIIWNKDWLGLGTAAYRATYELVCFYEKGHRPGTTNNVPDLLTHRRPHQNPSRSLKP